MRFVIFGLMLIWGSAAASGAEISGTVMSKTGKPLAGVMVMSRCRRYVETDSAGFFKLRDQGSQDCGNVIFFSLYGFRPLIKIVDKTTTEVHVVLDEMAHADREIFSCSDSGKRIGWYLRPPVPKGASVKKYRGLDGSGYTMRLSHNGKYASLEGSSTQWTYGFPDERWLLDAKEFTLRTWRCGEAEGVDVIGRASDGTCWRYFGTFGDAVMYSDVTEETAKFLDSIIDRVCIKQYASSQPSLPNELVATYSSGDEHAGVYLTLDAGGGYEIKSGTDTAGYFESGTYTFSAGVLSLTVIKKTRKLYGEEKETNELPQGRKAAQPSRLIFLKWSGRVYLLSDSEWEFLKFCNAVNLGVEPRKHLYAGDFFLRNGDEKREVVGNPALPGNWSSYLLSQPVTATIVKIEREGSLKESKIVIIDRGSKDGLKIGMILMEAAVSDEAPTFLFDPQVISVEEHTARISMSSSSKLKVGDRMSTKFIPGPFYQWWATSRLMQAEHSLGTGI